MNLLEECLRAVLDLHPRFHRATEVHENWRAFIGDHDVPAPSQHEAPRYSSVPRTPASGHGARTAQAPSAQSTRSRSRPHAVVSQVLRRHRKGARARAPSLARSCSRVVRGCSCSDRRGMNTHHLRRPPGEGTSRLRLRSGAGSPVQRARVARMRTGSHARRKARTSSRLVHGSRAWHVWLRRCL